MIKVILAISAAELKDLSNAVENFTGNLIIEVDDSQLKLFECPSPNDRGSLIKYVTRINSVIQEQ